MNTNNQLPLIANRHLDDIWIYTRDDCFTTAEILHYAMSLSQQMPPHGYCILLTEKRINFIIGFVAALILGKTILLPSNRSTEMVRSLLDDYPDSRLLDDAGFDQYVLTRGKATSIPKIDSRHLACLVFTSGSTGKPSANKKYWGDLVQGTARLQERFRVDASDHIIATVPAQHMYGLETTVLLSMLTAASVCGETPFFPEDIRQALVRSKKKSILVTTPIHLQACVRAGLVWPELRGIVSATALLTRTEAKKTECMMGVSINEIYGSTESGSIASRSPSSSDKWNLFTDVSLSIVKNGVEVVAGHLPHLPHLTDHIELCGQRSFVLHGRSSDMIKVAGKRASLGDLNHKLKSISGVIDGTFVQMEEVLNGASRMCVVVVAPSLSDVSIIESLAKYLDPVFLPRPIFRVDALPRNGTGKLPRAAIKKVLAELSRP